MTQFTPSGEVLPGIFGGNPTQEDLYARAYVPWGPGDRGLLIRQHHKSVPIATEIASELDAYQVRRSAATKVLAAGRPTYQNARQEQGRIAIPPSTDEIGVMVVKLETGVARWQALNKAGASKPVDANALRSSFQDACWVSYEAMIGAWSTWINAVGTSEDRQDELEQLQYLLCIRLNTGGTALHRPALVPGRPFSELGAVHGELPRFEVELKNAMNRLPPAAGKVK